MERRSLDERIKMATIDALNMEMHDAGIGAIATAFCCDSVNDIAIVSDDAIIALRCVYEDWELVLLVSLEDKVPCVLL